MTLPKPVQHILGGYLGVAVLLLVVKATGLVPGLSWRWVGLLLSAPWLALFLSVASGVAFLLFVLYCAFPPPDRK